MRPEVRGALGALHSSGTAPQQAQRGPTWMSCSTLVVLEVPRKLSTTMVPLVPPGTLHPTTPLESVEGSLKHWQCWRPNRESACASVTKGSDTCGREEKAGVGAGAGRA